MGSRFRDDPEYRQEFSIPEELDLELQKQFQVDQDFEEFVKTMTGKTTDELEPEELSELREQYSNKKADYGHKKRHLMSKMQFREDLDEALGGINRLSDMTLDYESVTENLQTPEYIEDYSKIRKAMDRLPPQTVRQGMDRLIENGKINAEQWAALVDDYMFAKNEHTYKGFGLEPEDVRPFIEGLLDDDIIDWNEYEFLEEKYLGEEWD